MAAHRHSSAKRSNQAPLPRPVQEHLGQQLRAAYREDEPKPAYLGDPALPATFDDVVHRLALRDAMRARARDDGFGAVRKALQDLLFAAQLSKH